MLHNGEAFWIQTRVLKWAGYPKITTIEQYFDLILRGVFHNRKKRTRRKVGGENMFLGIYDYTVILTYISLGISVFGITRALEGDFKVAIFCLALSGLCDMFDGKIARTKKNRTDDEKNFGIQIDSLSWRDYVSGGGAALAEPENYMTLR